MKFKIKAEIKLDTKLTPSHLQKILEPENQSQDFANIQTTVEGSIVTTEIVGTMKIGTLLRTIDDVLATTSLAESVSEETS